MIGSIRSVPCLAALLVALLSACGGGGGATAPSAPDSPSGVGARATGPSSISLTWTRPSGTLTGFDVRRATSAAGPYAEVATPPPAATGYGDAALATGATYHYQVRARSAAGSSPWTASVSATTDAGIAPSEPAAPSGLAATPQAGGAVELSWADNASDETGFEVQRAAGSGLFVTVGTPAADATAWTDGALSSATATPGGSAR